MPAYSVFESGKVRGTLDISEVTNDQIDTVVGIPLGGRSASPFSREIYDVGKRATTVASPV